MFPRQLKSLQQYPSLAHRSDEESLKRKNRNIKTQSMMKMKGPAETLQQNAHRKNMQETRVNAQMYK
jgi:hypothetical protein